MRTTLRQLRYLDAVAIEGRFGRAAVRCAVSQPALSAQIRSLEDGLGIQLVERTPTGARLTAAGAAVVARARQILSDVGDLESFARTRQSALSGPLRLGVIPSIAPYLLPKLLPRAAEAFPGLVLNVRESVTATLVDELVAGGLDLVVASVPLGHPGLAEHPLFDDAFLLAMPARGPFALVEIAAPDEIPPEALLLLEDGHCLRDQALSVCGPMDVRRLRSSGVTSLTTILQLVIAGQGITMLPELFLNASGTLPGAIRLKRFAAPEPRRTVGLAWRRTNPLAADFERLAGLVAACGRPEPPAPTA